MTEPLDPDRDSGQTPLPDPNGPDEELTEDDLDIDALVSVWKDDLLLDAIGRSARESDRLDVPFDVAADRQLIEALLTWRHDTEACPLAPVEPDGGQDTAIDADAGSPRRHRFRVPVVSVLAAAVAIVFTALAAYGATPDEALWPVTEVLYSQHAASIRAADDAGAAQAQAEAAMAAGQTRDAEAALHAAASRIPQVRSQDGQTKLQNRQHDLERQLTTPPESAAKPLASAPSTSRRTTSASAKPTSEQTTHASRPGSPSARAKESHDSTTPTAPATTTPKTHPTPQPTSASSPPRQHREQPGTPPRPTRSDTPTTTRPAAPSASRTDTGASQDRPRRVEPVKPSTKKSPPTTRQPQANSAADTGQAVDRSSSERTTGSRHTQAASPQRSDSPAPPPDDEEATAPPS
jgi:hypothetical protein